MLVMRSGTVASGAAAAGLWTGAGVAAVLGAAIAPVVVLTGAAATVTVLTAQHRLAGKVRRTETWIAWADQWLSAMVHGPAGGPSSAGDRQGLRVINGGRGAHRGAGLIAAA